MNRTISCLRPSASVSGRSMTSRCYLKSALHRHRKLLPRHRGKSAGTPPTTLIDYFPDDFLLFVDESRVTLPQVRAMYNGDHSRKQSLVDYGFRLPSAYDNRPLKFDEFEAKIHQAIFVSATPGDYEREHAATLPSSSSAPRGFLTRRSSSARSRGRSTI